jgi:hypothetical protein
LLRAKSLSVKYHHPVAPPKSSDGTAADFQYFKHVMDRLEAAVASPGSSAERVVSELRAHGMNEQNAIAALVEGTAATFARSDDGGSIRRFLGEWIIYLDRCLEINSRSDHEHGEAAVLLDGQGGAWLQGVRLGVYRALSDAERYYD